MLVFVALSVSDDDDHVISSGLWAWAWSSAISSAREFDRTVEIVSAVVVPLGCVAGFHPHPKTKFATPCLLSGLLCILYLFNFQ